MNISLIEMSDNNNDTCHEALFLTGAHSALQLVTTFTMTKYTSATDALS